jgi:ketosteroid isomerase-like protein
VSAAAATDRAAVLAAARARADALAAGDAAALTGLLHEDFRWTAHNGATFDREEYVRRNTDGTTVWRSQDLADADVLVVGDTAVLLAQVTDVVEGDDGGAATFRMPMTQTWVREGDRWRCLAGHAGPRRTD